MTKTIGSWAAICGALALFLLGFGRTGRAAPPGASALPGVSLTSYDASVGKPVRVGALTIFPIYAHTNPAHVDTVSLETAIARGDAAVREVGPADGTGATIGAVMLENRGTAPLLVLAGTVIEGGNQDRQFAEDFVIAGGKSVDVGAYCVEQGRWDETREGRDTGGVFKATGMLAPRRVRNAAQHGADQSEVWDAVQKTNRMANKQAASDTIMATLNARDMQQKTAKLASALARALARVPQQGRVQGVAYAIDGEVRGARWFATRTLFEQHETKLLEAAAMEVILTSRAGSMNLLSARQVGNFVDNAGRARVDREAQRGDILNINVYKRTAEAAAAETRLVTHHSGSTARSSPVTVDISRL